MLIQGSFWKLAMLVGRNLGVASILFLAMTLQVADAQLAPGVQQSSAKTATIIGTAFQDSKPLAGTTILLAGPATLSTKTDTSGAFFFTGVPFGSYLLTATNGSATVSQVITLSEDIIVSVQLGANSSANVTTIKTIGVVSTKAAGAHINVTPANITSISPIDYALKGNANWKELLNQLPGVTVGGNLFGGGSIGDSIPDAPIFPIIISINGALPYETSVTLDGMPVEVGTRGGSPGNGTDLFGLPMVDFETADIVRGPGANSPSIVDSIGGSFVLHAPSRVNKNEFEFSVSNDPYGGVLTNGRAAVRFGRLSTNISYAVNDSPGPLGSTTVTPVFVSLPATVNGQLFAGCGASYVFGCTNFVNPPGPQYLNCFCEVQDGLLYAGLPLSTAWSQHSGAVAFSYDVMPSVMAQVFYAGSRSVMQQPFLQYPVNFTPGPGYTGPLSPGLHTGYYGSPNALAQATSLLEEKITAYLGRGVVRLAAMQNNSYQDILSTNYPNGQYTLYGTGYYSSAPSTPVNFNGTTATLTFPNFFFPFTGWVNNRDQLLSYETQIGLASTAGVSYTTSYYNNPSLQIPASQNQPQAISQTSNEMRIRVGTELSRKLSLDTSWYFALGTYHVQNPSDPTGNTYTDSVFRYNAPRLGAVWRASNDIAIRASAGGGFALPPLYQLVGTNGVPQLGTGFYTVFLTNLNLTPEKSFGFDLGTDIRVHPDTALSFDLYRTNLYGQLFQSTNVTGTFNGLPLYTTQFQNVSQSRFEGVDMDLRREVPKGIYWHGALGLTRAYVVSVPSGFYDQPGAPNSVNLYVVPGINYDGEFQSNVPYANGNGQLGYRWAPEKYVDLSGTYYGNNNSFFQKAFVEFDAHAGYGLTKNFSLLATVRNLTAVHGQNQELYAPSMGAPTITGLPYAVFGLPYGPRSLILTLNYKS